MACNRKNPAPGSASGSALRLSSNSGVQFENSSFGDTTDTKLFVGGLPWETDRDALRRHFQKFGEIQEAVVITEKNTGKSKGYGFVTFSDRESAARACDDPTPVIDGRKANCNLASRGRPQKDSAGYTRPGSSGSFYGGLQPLPRSNEFGNSSLYYYPSTFYEFAYPIPMYGYSGYRTEYMYPQNISGGQYLQMQRFPGFITNPSSVYPYGLPSCYDSSSSYKSYEISAQQFLQLRGTNPNGMVTAGTIPAATQSRYPPVIAARVQPQPTHTRPPRFTQDSGGSDHPMAA